MKDWKLPVQFVTNVFTFLEKVVSTRAFIWSIHLNTLFGFCWPLWACLSLLEQFISSINPSGFPFDVIPPQLLKKVFPTLGPFILAIINSTLTFCKHIFGQFLLTKTGLDHSVLFQGLSPGYLSCLNFPPPKKKNCLYLTEVLRGWMCNSGSVSARTKNSPKQSVCFIKAFLMLYILARASGDYVLLVLLDWTAAF